MYSLFHIYQYTLNSAQLNLTTYSYSLHNDIAIQNKDITRCGYRLLGAGSVHVAIEQHEATKHSQQH